MRRSLAGFLLICAVWGADHSVLRGEESDPYYFVDDTIDESDRDRRPRKVLPGARTFTQDKTDDGSPEYRRKRSPLDNLKYLEPGGYEAKIVGILCNSCTNAVVIQLKKIKDISSASFDFEEGILRFTVTELKNRPQHKLRFKKVLRAVKRAGRKARLGTKFTLFEIKKVR